LEALVLQMMESRLPAAPAEPVVPPPRPAAEAPRGVAAGLAGLFGADALGGAQEEEESSDGSEDWLLPGGGRGKQKAKEVKPAAAAAAAPPADPAAALLNQPLGAGGGADVNLMVQVEMIKTLKALVKDRRRGGGSSDDTDAEKDNSDSAAEDELMKSSAKAFRNQHKLRRRIRCDSDRLVKEFLKQAREELGVVRGQAWTLLDWAKRQKMSRSKGLLRSMVILIAVLEKSLSGKEAEARALAVQGIKATLQVSLHGGSWDRGAWLLTGLADPVEEKTFAGTPGEMAAVASYMKAVEQLKVKVGGGVSDVTEGVDVKLTKAQRRALKKQQEKEAAEGKKDD
jgi:hypothetical protein